MVDKYLTFSDENSGTALFLSAQPTNKSNLLGCLISFLVQIKNFTHKYLK